MIFYRNEYSNYQLMDTDPTPADPNRLTQQELRQLDREAFSTPGGHYATRERRIHGNTVYVTATGLSDQAASSADPNPNPPPT